MNLLTKIYKKFPKPKMEVISYQCMGKTIIEILDIGDLRFNTHQIFINIYKNISSGIGGWIYINQFIDERQGKENFLELSLIIGKMKKENSLQISSNYYDPYISGQKEYVFHIEGRANYLPVFDLLCFGMTSIPNIIYFRSKKILNWRHTVLEWNKKVLKWYWHEGKDEDLLDVKNQNDFVCWTSDGHINLLIDDEVKNSFIQTLEYVCMIYNLEFVINEKKDFYL